MSLAVVLVVCSSDLFDIILITNTNINFIYIMQKLIFGQVVEFDVIFNLQIDQTLKVTFDNQKGTFLMVIIIYGLI